jgi:hypothetical protein
MGRGLRDSGSPLEELWGSGRTQIPGEDRPALKEYPHPVANHPPRPLIQRFGGPARGRDAVFHLPSVAVPDAQGGHHSIIFYALVCNAAELFRPLRMPKILFRIVDQQDEIDIRIDTRLTPGVGSRQRNAPDIGPGGCPLRDIPEERSDGKGRLRHWADRRKKTDRRERPDNLFHLDGIIFFLSRFISPAGQVPRRSGHFPPAH